MPVSRSGFQAFANAIWTLVAVGSRTVEVNTKTGFSLTAGSYSIRASDVQGFVVGIANGQGPPVNTTIAAVTLARASLDYCASSGDVNTVGNSSAGCYLAINSTTNVQMQRENSSGINSWGFRVKEFY